jgi:hypothetical protein
MNKARHKDMLMEINRTKGGIIAGEAISDDSIRKLATLLADSDECEFDILAKMLENILNERTVNQLKQLRGGAIVY